MPHHDPDSLDELLLGAFRRLRRRWASQLAPFGLTPHQFRALDALAGAPASRDVGEAGACGGTAGRRVKDLAEALRIAPRSATEVVDLLQEKGLVERVADRTDRRATLVSLTPPGAALRGRVRAARRRESDEYFSRLTPEDRAELERLLRLLAADEPGCTPRNREGTPRIGSTTVQERSVTMTAQQPEDRGEAFAEQQQEDLHVVDDDALTDSTTADNRRIDADPAEGGPVPTEDVQARTGPPADNQ
ncbi:MarR family transcriptional regulator [Kocuria sediminis]|uniref:MarR family transcriptional regulator n=1 Tax=Kocuria sediminis TaxID=1038857 RepID=A0A6N8GK85_9MICC|nr:MarR family winged helix-turn-helix transcriptional regulator [Kocuria sediminis]MUN62652.1 MarR family transcriptional regulator [Kocuria sediminis]